MSLPFSFTEPISTEQLTLRPMRADDLDDVHAYQSREDVCRYLMHEPRSREELVPWIAKQASATELAAEHDWLQPAIELDGRVIGQMYLTITTVESRGAEIGWVLHPDFFGKGYASEAATALLDLSFDELGMHRVRADLDPRNAASIALCRRLGMREEALHVKDLMFRGEWADTGIYAILDEEWAARTPLVEPVETRESRP